jgi:hypothetical protein
MSLGYHSALIKPHGHFEKSQGREDSYLNKTVKIRNDSDIN